MEIKTSFCPFLYPKLSKNISEFRAPFWVKKTIQPVEKVLAELIGECMSLIVSSFSARGI
jgi:hypothetical protein